MAKPRSSLISLSDTPYYHCIARCVRRSYLCGYDKTTKKSFEHRKVWLVERIQKLAAIFTIDVAAYAVMSNHYHIVLRVNTDAADALSPNEVLSRWHTLCQPKPIVVRYLQAKQQGKTLTESELMVVNDCVKDYRQRLTSISWFMRFLNEFIARQANLEDKCKGHFWEGRFKSQALLDDVTVLACMAYVDLNPIRAKMADTPENSDFTSIQQRLGILPKAVETDNHQNKDGSQKHKTATPNDNLTAIAPAQLLPFVKANNESVPNFKRSNSHIPFSLIDYLELVDWTGRQIRQDKRGFISLNTPSIIQRLGLTDEDWLAFSTGIENQYSHSVGQRFQLQTYAKNHQLKRVKGLRQ
ncbi:transposase [Catenovulum maritimum]|uniref:transposase n=1 Tax=Catenovulum maritimum TaxID=1513271 RepID=UPI00097C3631|nr:transposase [Catenovulum maritimum]